AVPVRAQPQADLLQPPRHRSTPSELLANIARFLAIQAHLGWAVLMQNNSHSPEHHSSEHWDAVVVGGGAAGLSAAQMLGRSRRRVLVVDSGRPRNRFAAHVHGVLGHDGVEPAELVRRGREELRQYDVTVRSGSVTSVDDDEDGLVVHLAEAAPAHARALIVASGQTDALPDTPGRRDHSGTGVRRRPPRARGRCSSRAARPLPSPTSGGCATTGARGCCTVPIVTAGRCGGAGSRSSGARRCPRTRRSWSGSGPMIWSSSRPEPPTSTPR